MCLNITHFNGVTLDNELQESRVAIRQWPCKTGSEWVKFGIARIIGNSFFRFLKFVFKDETVAPHYLPPFTCSLFICHSTQVFTSHSTCVDMPLSIHVFTCHSTHVFTCHSTHFFTCHSTQVFTCHSTQVFICHSTHLFTCHPHTSYGLRQPTLFSFQLLVSYAIEQ